MTADNVAAGMTLLRNMQAGIGFAANARTRRERQERYAGCLNMFATLTGRDVYEVDAEVCLAGTKLEPEVDPDPYDQDNDNRADH